MGRRQAHLTHFEGHSPIASLLKCDFFSYTVVQQLVDKISINNASRGLSAMDEPLDIYTSFIVFYATKATNIHTQLHVHEHTKTFKK